MCYEGTQLTKHMDQNSNYVGYGQFRSSVPIDPKVDTEQSVETFYIELHVYMIYVPCTSP